MERSVSSDVSSAGLPARPLHERFFMLDGLRGVAALAVAVRHAPFLWPDGHPEGILHESYLAVDFFFVLSGFVLAHAYSMRLLQGMGFKQFLQIRLVRLYPLYALAFAMGLVIAAGGVFVTHSMAFPQYLGNAFFGALFLPSPFSGDTLFPFNSPAWSLFFELLANAMLVPLLKIRQGKWIFLVALVSIVAMIFGVFGNHFGFGSSHGPLDAGVTWISFWAGFLRVCYSFFAGLLIFNVMGRGVRPEKESHPLVFVGLLGVTLLASPPLNMQAWFELVSVVIIFPMIVFFGSKVAIGKRGAWLCELLGNASYAVYILQVPAYRCMGFLCSKTLHIDAHEVRPALGAASVAAVLLFAIMADRYFDIPVRKKLQHFMKG